MRNAKWPVLRLNSNGRSTCEDVRRLTARIEVALRNVPNLYRAPCVTVGKEFMK